MQSIFIPDSIVKKRNNSIHCIDHFKIAWFQYKNEYIIWYNLAMWRRPGADQAQIKRRPTEIHGEMHVKWSRLHFLRMLTFMGCRTLPMLNWIAFRNVFLLVCAWSAPGLRHFCIYRQKRKGCNRYSFLGSFVKKRKKSLNALTILKLYDFNTRKIIWYNLAMWRRPGADQAQTNRNTWWNACQIKQTTLPENVEIYEV